jgi:hypothetical protein
MRSHVTKNAFIAASSMLLLLAARVFALLIYSCCSRKYAPGINPAFAIIAALLEKRPEKRAALNDRYF